MKSRSLLLSLAFATVPALLAGQAGAAVPATDSLGLAAYSTCPTVVPAPTSDRIYHFDKIVFELLGPLAAALAADQANLNNVPRNTPLDIKVVDRPTTVADLKGKVLSFLGAQTTAANRANVRIGQVLYSAVVCQKPAP